MSGALSAFLRGAAGPGLIDWTNNQRRQDELEAQRQQRDKEIAAAAAERDQARKENLEFRNQDRQDRLDARDREIRMNLDARYGPADPETGARAGGGALRRAGAGGAGGNDETNIIGEVMARTGMSEADVRQRMAQGQAGFTRKAQQVEQFDDGDGRMRNATKEVEEPDVKAYMEFNRKLGAAMKRSGGNPQQRAIAEQTDFETESGRAAQAPGLPQQRVGELATGVAVAGAKPLFKDGDSQYTPAVGALTQSKVNENNALANKRKAEAAGGGAGGLKMRSSNVNAAGDRMALMSDGSQVNLGKDATYQTMLSREAAAIAKTSDGFNLKPDEIERMAAERIAKRASSGAAPAAPGASPPAPKPAGTTPPPTAALANAKAAIAKGAPRAAVIQRLKDAGYDTTGI